MSTLPSSTSTTPSPSVARNDETAGPHDDAGVIDRLESSMFDQEATWTIDPQVTSAVRYTLNRWALSSDGPIPSVVAVVSVLRGEGVTTVSKAFATLLDSDFGGRVCWLDLSSPAAKSSADDVPSVERSMVWDAAHGGSSHEDALRGSGQEGVYVLAAGSAVADDRHAFVNGSGLDELITRLRGEFDFIVIDTPPVSSDSDSLAMMRLVDAYLLVVRHGSTTTAQIRSAVDELRTVPSLGAILNEYRTRTPRFIRRILSM